MRADEHDWRFRMGAERAEIAELIDTLADDLHGVSSWADDAELQVWCSLVQYASGALDVSGLGGMAVQDVADSVRMLDRLLELVRRQQGFWRGRAHLVRQAQFDDEAPAVQIGASGYDEMPRWERLPEMAALTGRSLSG